MKRPLTLIYSVDEKVPLVTGLIVTLQHGVILLITLLTPTLIVNLAIGSAPKIAASLTEVSMLIMALGCVLLALRNKSFGCGYLCPVVCDSAYMVMTILALKEGGVPLFLGMNIFAGFIIMGFASSLHAIRKWIPPEVTGICILMIGVGIIAPTVQSSLGIMIGPQFNVNTSEAFIFITTFALTVLISIWGNDTLSRFNLVIAFVIGDILAYFCHLFNQNTLVALHQHRLLSVPHVDFIGHYQFSLDLLIPFAVAALSASMKTLGNIANAQRINDADWIKPNFHSMRNAIYIQGLITILSGFFGGVGMGTSASNVGISEATRITSRYINMALGAFLFALAFFPKALYFIICTPAPVRGAILLYAVCFMIISGLKMIVTRSFDMRRIMVVSISFCLGLVIHFVPGFTNIFPPLLRPIFSSSLSTATLSAFLLNLLFRLGSTQTMSQQVNLQSSFELKVWEDFKNQCVHWGVQAQMIQKAEHAMLYCLEAIQLLATEPQLDMSIKYDEYNFNFILTYHGKYLDLVPDSPAKTEGFLDKSKILSTAVTLLQIHARDIKTKCDHDNVTVSFTVME